MRDAHVQVVVQPVISFSFQSKNREQFTGINIICDREFATGWVTQGGTESLSLEDLWRKPVEAAALVA